MIYSVRIKDSAAKELARLPRDVRERLVDAIDGLAEEPLARQRAQGRNARLASTASRRLPDCVRNCWTGSWRCWWYGWAPPPGKLIAEVKQGRIGCPPPRLSPRVRGNSHREPH